MAHITSPYFETPAQPKNTKHEKGLSKNYRPHTCALMRFHLSLDEIAVVCQ